MDKTEIAINGDFFMLPDYFVKALNDTLDPTTLEIRTKQGEWPNEPMTIRKGDLPIDEYFGDEDETAEFIGNAKVFITHLAPLTEKVLAQVPNLELIGISRGGPINIEMEAAHKRGIKVVNTPGRNANAVAEFTVGMIFAEVRKIREGHESLRQGIWRGDLYREDITGHELPDLTVGLLGYGRIGVLLAKYLKPFGCKLLVADPYVTIDEPDLIQVSKDELLEQSDIVTVNVRVTPETVKIIGKKELQQMKNTALLVNVARGPLVDYEALEEALVNKEIAAAALDTFQPEPPDKNYSLLRLPNVTVTPHIAGASKRTVRIAAEQIAEEVRRHFAGEDAMNLVK